MPTVDQLIQILKLAPRYLITISFFCGSLLLVNDNISKALGIFQFTQDYRKWIGIFFVGSISLLVTDWGIKIIAIVRNLVRDMKFKKSLIQSLNTITEEEKQILRYYIAMQSKTNTLRIDDGIVNTLVAKGVIYLSSNQGRLIDGFSHNINELAWDYLNENPSLLEGTTNTYRTDKTEALW